MINSESDALAHIEAMVAQAQERAVQAQAMAADMDALRVTGHSQDGSAEITLSSTGALVDLYVSSSLQGRGGDEIRAKLLQANAAAQRALSERVTQVSAEHFGADSATTREFSQRYSEMFDKPDPDDDGPRPGGAGVLR